MSEYYSQIIRNPELEDGPGIETLFYNDEPVAMWPVVTGDKVLDPAEYGGICPPIRVYMEGPIHDHVEPGRNKSMDHCTILPVDEDREILFEKYPKRTWDRDVGDDFKRHSIGWGMGGKSTGCLCPLSWYWQYAKEWLNKAYQHSQENDYVFVTEVADYTSV